MSQHHQYGSYAGGGYQQGGHPPSRGRPQGNQWSGQGGQGGYGIPPGQNMMARPQDYGTAAGGYNQAGDRGMTGYRGGSVAQQSYDGRDPQYGGSVPSGGGGYEPPRYGGGGMPSSSNQPAYASSYAQTGAPSSHQQYSPASQNTGLLSAAGLSSLQRSLQSLQGASAPTTNAPGPMTSATRRAEPAVGRYGVPASYTPSGGAPAAQGHARAERPAQRRHDQAPSRGYGVGPSSRGYESVPPSRLYHPHRGGMEEPEAHQAVVEPPPPPPRRSGPTSRPRVSAGGGGGGLHPQPSSSRGRSNGGARPPAAGPSPRSPVRSSSRHRDSRPRRWTPPAGMAHHRHHAGGSQEPSPAPAQTLPYGEKTFSRLALAAQYPRLALEKDVVRVDRFFPNDAREMEGSSVASLLCTGWSVPAVHETELLKGKDENATPSSVIQDTVETKADDSPVPDGTVPAPICRSAKLRGVRVLFSCGLDEQEQEAVLTGGREGASLERLLKFVVIRTEQDGRKSGIHCLGGPVDPRIDGAWGEAGLSEDDILQAAAIRHCREQVGLDLAAAQRWLHLADVTYQRLDERGLEHHTETVSLLLVDATPCLPEVTDWSDVWEAFQAAAKGPKEGDVPESDDLDGAMSEEKEKGLTVADDDEGQDLEAEIIFFDEQQQSEAVQEAGEGLESAEARAQLDGDLLASEEDGMDAGVEGVDTAEALISAAEDQQQEEEGVVELEDGIGKGSQQEVGPDQTSSKLLQGTSSVPGLAPSPEDADAEDADADASAPGNSEQAEPVENMINGDEEEEEEGAIGTPASTSVPAGMHVPAYAPLPEQPALCLLGRTLSGERIRSQSISLDGLLDYNLSDRGAGSFELNLFAEALADALALEYAGEVCAALRREHTAAVSRQIAAGGKNDSGKRPRGEEPATVETEPPKRAKSTTDEEEAPVEEEMPLLVVEDVDGPEKRKTEEEDDASAVPKPLPKKEKTVLKPLLWAFRFFDKAGRGFLRAGELTRIVQSAQPFLHHLLVKEWVETVTESVPSGLRSDKVRYVTQLCQQGEQEEAEEEAEGDT